MKKSLGIMESTEILMQCYITLTVSTFQPLYSIIFSREQNEDNILPSSRYLCIQPSYWKKTSGQDHQIMWPHGLSGKAEVTKANNQQVKYTIKLIKKSSKNMHQICLNSRT